MGTVPLSTAIEALREALTEAIEMGRPKRMRFKLAPVELTVQAVVTGEAGANIGWSILGADASYSTATTQTLKLQLTPYWIGDDGTWTEDALISTQASTEDSDGPAPQIIDRQLPD